MEDNLITLLETFKYPVIRQGSMPQGASYPDTFFTFWNNEESEHSAYDNETLNTDNRFDVNVYSTSPSTAYLLLGQARGLLKENGWTITTRGYDVASDEITHTGRGMEVCYLNNEMEVSSNG